MLVKSGIFRKQFVFKTIIGKPFGWEKRAPFPPLSTLCCQYDNQLEEKAMWNSRTPSVCVARVG
jgi:hypothetical protein